MLGRGILGNAAPQQSVFHLEPTSRQRRCPESEAQLLACEQMSFTPQAVVLQHRPGQMHAARQAPPAVTKRTQYILI